jgi:SPP1 gp7 family putative phage head morphogenesis protein
MLKPIHPAAPIRAKYQQRLDALIDEMHRSILHWIKAEWRRNTPETVLYGADEDPVKALQAALSKLGKRWQRKFDDLADNLAEYFAQATRLRSDRALQDMLRKGGFSVKFKMTPAMRDAFNAVRAENIGLIKSIAQQHLAHVDTLVMQSVARGGDLGTLAKALEKTTGVTKRRAALIARDQNNKATAVLTRTRHLELGITTAKWLHSAGGKHPRPEHKAFSGKTYDIREGHDFDDGEGPVWPGQLINCRCVSVPIVPGFSG